MLRSVRHDGELFDACRYIDNSLYLSSYLIIQNALSVYSKLIPGETLARQGPSIEGWSRYMDTSQSGLDRVLSIHCPFWPDAAQEWQTRQRKFAWPSAQDVDTILDFGFHFVPVGHPHSDKNMMEWRMSFTVAERSLVWTFSHVQLQCYAVMKLILKEFINVHCSPPSRVLCSYFIKTLLFWEYEETDPSYWRKENFRECIMHLLSRFCECLRMGMLKHYFIPNFNLLSVKLTAQNQRELLRIFDMILKSDICIIKQCKTLTNIWRKCLSPDNDMYVPLTPTKDVFRKDKCLMVVIDKFENSMSFLRTYGFIKFFASFNQLLKCFNNIVYKTPVISFVVRMAVTCASIKLGCLSIKKARNKCVYTWRRNLQSNVCGFDISTCRLWCSMLQTKLGDYRESLRNVNNVLFSISQLVLYYNGHKLCNVNDGTIRRYDDTFIDDDKNVTERARRGWMFNLRMMYQDMCMVPTAFQIELIHSDRMHGIYLSPFICAHYLMFLNYDGLGQYDERDRALQTLIDTVNNPEQRGHMDFHSYNIAGHCLLSIGEYMQARDMFIRSYLRTRSQPLYHRLNSAEFYLEFMARTSTDS